MAQKRHWLQTHNCRHIPHVRLSSHSSENGLRNRADILFDARFCGCRPRATLPANSLHARPPRLTPPSRRSLGFLPSHWACAIHACRLGDTTCPRRSRRASRVDVTSAAMSRACFSDTCSGRLMTLAFSARVTGNSVRLLCVIAIGRHVGNAIVDKAPKLHALPRDIGDECLGLVDARNVVRIGRAGDERRTLDIAAGRQRFVIYRRNPAAMLDQRVVSFRLSVADTCFSGTHRHEVVARHIHDVLVIVFGEAIDQAEPPDLVDDGEGRREKCCGCGHEIDGARQTAKPGGRLQPLLHARSASAGQDPHRRL